MKRRELLESMGAGGAALLLPTRAFGLATPRHLFVSPAGKDSNDGLTSATPLQTLQAASNRALPGDTVFAMNGNYTNPNPNTDVLIIRTSGVAGAPISYRHFPGHKPRIVVAVHNWCGIKVAANYITIEGFEVYGNAQNINYDYAYSERNNYNNPATSADGISVDGRTVGTRRNINLRNNVVHHMPGGGISAIATDYVTIENNRIYSCSWWTPYANSGISVYSSRHVDSVTSPYKTIVRRNTCYGNENFIGFILAAGVITDGNGIIIDDNKNTQHAGVPAYTGRTLVENNLCFNNGGAGVLCYSSANVNFVNNTAYFNNRCPSLDKGEIVAWESTAVRLHNNVLYARTGKKCQTHNDNGTVWYDSNIYYNGPTAVRGSTDIVADPKFVKASLNPAEADFSTVLASPAIGSGTSVLAPGEDIDLKLRPSGIGFDRGAYQHTVTNDLTAPAVSIAASGTAGTVRITATATDDVGVKQVNFYVNGKFKKSSTGPAYIFDYIKLAGAKRVTILAKATDNAGNTGTSNKIVI